MTDRDPEGVLREWADRCSCEVLKMREVPNSDGRYERYDCGECLPCRTRAMVVTEGRLPASRDKDVPIEDVMRASIKVGEDRMRDRIVNFLIDWERELSDDHSHTARSILLDAAGELEHWDD